MLRITRYFILLITLNSSLFTLHSSLCQAQTYRLFSTDNGLTSSLVNYVLEDRYGQIWIATEDGLNRYDGVKITSYKHRDGDNTSLASNYVSTLIEDAKGNLIVSTYNGLQIYHHDTDDFSPIATSTDGKAMRANISNLLLERDGRLYGTGDVACEVLTKDRNRLEIRRLQKPYFDNSIPSHLPRELNIRETMRYDNGHLLLGTDGDGVKLYDEAHGSYTDFPLDIPGIPQHLQKVHNMMRDRSGNLWLALYQKGVVVMSQQKSMFGYLGSKSAKGDIIGSHCILSMCRSKKGGMWVGTDGDGLYYIEASPPAQASPPALPRREGADSCRDLPCRALAALHFALRQKPLRGRAGGEAPIINAVMEDSEGTVWIGSYGYPCYKGQNGKFAKVEGLPDNPRVFCLKEDRNHNVWLGTMGNGLYRYNIERHAMEYVECNGMNRYVNSIYILSNGNVVACTFNGIYNATTHEHFCEKQIVYCMHEDARGRLWLGTADGLIVLDKGREKTYTSANGMPSNTVYAITEDKNGRLWFSSNSGLSCFDEHEGVFTNYSVRDGLQGNEFSKGAMVRDDDGTLWFAGHEGITYFLPPSNGRAGDGLFHPRITALYINNVAVNANTLTGGEPVIDTALFDARHFTIAYENNSFSIELSAAEIFRPAECSYCYSIDGGEWITIPDGGHIVSFSNLDAGTHTLRYAVEYNGKRSEAEEVSIEVRHPWWGTLWAKGLMVLVIAIILTLIYFWIRSKEKVRALALISHKIRTPMSLIISPLVQLIDNDKDEKRQKTYQLMLRNAEKLQHLAAQATEEEPIGPIDLPQPLPRRGELTGEEGTSASPLLGRGRGRSLVIVEDDDDVRHYLCEQLSADYHVREATNGKDALELIFQKQPDAIISDVTMPEMDGITLCKKLKKNIKLAHIPVILLTARADEESTLQGLGIGADAYITKPFNIKILRQNIANLILLRRQLRNTYQDQLLQEDKQKDVEAVDYEDQFMQRLMDCINRHISDCNFSIEALCEEVGISRAQLHRRLKEKTNQSTSIFIRNVRLHQAAKLLTESDMRVSEVADMVGFSQITYFCNQFKDLYGVSPTEYREKNVS